MDPVHGGRSRVHFNASNSDEEAGPTVDVTSFDPDPESELELVTDEGKTISESISKDDRFTKDITEIQKLPSSFYFEDSDQSDEEEIDPHEDNEHINRLLRFKSASAPTSPQTTPVLSPHMFPQNRDLDIPLLDLNANRTPHTGPTDSRPSSAGTIVGGDRDKRCSMDSDNFGKREAERLVREHTKRHRSMDFFRHISSGDILRSETSTPEDDGDSKHYTFNSGVLTNLLKLCYRLTSYIDCRYNEQPNSGNTPPSHSGRTTPKWYSKSPNNSTTSLNAVLASSTRLAGVPGLATSDTLSINGNQEGSHHSFRPFHRKSKFENQFHLMTNRIADVLQRQRFILLNTLLHS